jgi:hypothetical protein
LVQFAQPVERVGRPGKFVYGKGSRHVTL